MNAFNIVELKYLLGLGEVSTDEAIKKALINISENKSLVSSKLEESRINGNRVLSKIIANKDYILSVYPNNIEMVSFLELLQSTFDNNKVIEDYPDTIGCSKEFWDVGIILGDDKFGIFKELNKSGDDDTQMYDEIESIQDTIKDVECIISLVNSGKFVEVEQRFFERCFS